MFFKSSGLHGKRGFALLETTIAAGIATVIVLVLCTFAIFSGHSFAALFNYVDLDDANRIAMDRITRDVRQANRVKAATAVTLTLEDADSTEINYQYNPTTRVVTRQKTGRPMETLLTECDRLLFTLGQRNPVGGTFDVYNPSSMDVVKVVNVSWRCSRKIFGRIANTESVQTARIVIRKQGT
jgi:Tfp pilus assembly protein PilW